MAFAATASKRGAFADMDKPAINVAKELAQLSELTIFELRGEWRRLHRMPPPTRLSRDLVDPRDHLQTSGAGVRRPFPGHRTEAGAGRRQFAEPRLGYTRAADLLEAGHSARNEPGRGFRPKLCAGLCARWGRLCGAPIWTAGFKLV